MVNLHGNKTNFLCCSLLRRLHISATASSHWHECWIMCYQSIGRTTPGAERHNVQNIEECQSVLSVLRSRGDGRGRLVQETMLPCFRSRAVSRYGGNASKHNPTIWPRALRFEELPHPLPGACRIFRAQAPAAPVAARTMPSIDRVLSRIRSQKCRPLRQPNILKGIKFEHKDYMLMAGGPGSSSSDKSTDKR